MRLLLLTTLLLLPTTQPQTQKTFTNPILTKSAGDPTILLHKGHYYLAATGIDRNAWSLLKSKSLTDFNNAEKITIWQAPANPTTQPTQAFIPTRELWAPELLHYNNRFYFYFTALGPQGYHRHYVLDADNIEGPYTFRGDVDPDHNAFALDGAVLEHNGKLYWLYAGDRKEAGLNIAPMSSPLRVAKDAPRTTFATGNQPWEAAWWQEKGQWKKGNHAWLEAPQPLYHNGRTFLAYSAGHTGTPSYYLGLIELTGPDPMIKDNWRKFNQPFLAPTEQTVTTGHNTFTTSPDSKEHWLLYHARDINPSNPWDRQIHRTLRAQPLTFTPEGLPHTTSPIPTTQPLPLPSGQN